ncbi:MAG: ABC transporter substrate-binding protein [Myxococcota bacterium]
MRIVTLLPSATEIVASLGAEQAIVGISHECDQPPSITDRPRVTSSTLPEDIGTRAIDARVVQAMVRGDPLYVVDATRLEALQPDVVITQAVCQVCAVTQTQIGMLELLTGTQIVTLQALDFAGMLSDVRLVADAIGRTDEAETLVNELQGRWDALSEPNPTGPTVLFAEWPDPLWLGGHWVPELISAAGGVDPFGTPGASSERSAWSDAMAQDPDIVVFGACGYDLVQNIESARPIETGSARRYAIDANRLVSRATPALVDALEVLKAIVHDELDGTDPSWVRALAPTG